MYRYYGGFDNTVYSLLTVNDEIFIGGDFTKVIESSEPSNRICKLSDKYVNLKVNNEYITNISKKERKAVLISNSNGYLI